MDSNCPYELPIVIEIDGATILGEQQNSFGCFPPLFPRQLHVGKDFFAQPGELLACHFD